MPAPLLDTKLHLPRSRPGAVRRPRLVEQLDRGTSATLTLVSAPAGFGKTTLLTQWLESRDEAASGAPDVAWLSLDAGDNDPRSYWSYLVAALRTVAPDIGVGELALLQSADPPPVQRLLTTLLNDLGALSTDVVLVLDDYHVIESVEVHQAMEFLLNHVPARLHLVIASRADPSVPLARLRARGELVEVRVTDLRFTPDEAASYLVGAMGLALTAREVSALEGRTEGWIAALQLAALSMQGREDVAGFIASFTGDDRYIVDYLVEEVLQRQPHHLETFLLHTSILDRFDGALCDAVTAQGGGKATLEALDRANLFLVPLDDHRRWYRYHHLFADVLRARLLDEQPDHVRTLHQRASKWYEEHGHPAEAIRHALAAPDFERAADLVEREFPASRRDRREGTLLGWLEQLPEEVLGKRPVLSVVYAGTLLSTGSVDGVERRLRDAERWLAADGPTNPATAPEGMVVVDDAELSRLPGWLAIYRAAQALMLGDAATTVAHASRALDLLEQGDQIGRAAASALKGLASWAGGDLESAHQAYATCLDIFHQAGYLSDVLACSITLGDIRVAQGRLREAMGTYERALRLAGHDDAARGTALRGAADMYVGMAAVHRELNDLDAARKCLQISHDLGEHNGLPQNRYRWRVASARVREAEGDPDAALSLLEEAERAYVGDFTPEVRPVPAVKTRVQIALGRLDEAFAWARERRLSVDDPLTYLREFEHLTLARMLVARFALERSQDAATDATTLLERLLRAAEEGGRVASVLEVLVLQTRVQQLRGDTAAALVPLQRALRLAEPEGYARVFLDEGPSMVSALEAAADESIAPEYIGRILTVASVDRDSAPRIAAGQDVLEPLSDRERDVLRLLATDLGGPDIARQLVVSLSTVRTHTRNIYAKLGVNNRRAAVRRAEELDLVRATRHRR